MDETSLPTNIDDCHQLIAKLQSQVSEQVAELQQKDTVLSLKDNLIEEQAHSVLELKADADKLDEKVAECKRRSKTVAPGGVLVGGVKT